MFSLFKSPEGKIEQQSQKFFHAYLQALKQTDDQETGSLLNEVRRFSIVSSADVGVVHFLMNLAKVPKAQVFETLLLWKLEMRKKLGTEEGQVQNITWIIW